MSEPKTPTYLKYLRLSRWRADAALEGEVTFEGEFGKIEMKLSDIEVQKILEIVADKLQAISKDASIRFSEAIDPYLKRNDL